MIRHVVSSLQRRKQTIVPVVLGVAVLVAHLAVANAIWANSKDTAVRQTVREVEHRFEARYKHASTLKAVFYERYGSGQGNGEAESGTVYFSRPGRMRWDYESPEKKLFIVDGKNVWFYIPDDHTASRTTLKNSSDWRTPIALLAEDADLGRVCRNIQLVANQNDTSVPLQRGQAQTRPYALEGTHRSSGKSGVNRLGPAVPAVSGADSVLKCTPKAATDETGQPISNVLLTIDREGYLVRVLIQQPGDITTEFRFGNWQENIHIAEPMFHFEPPAGVEIVDEDKLAGQMQ
jgi:chaperone LolA